MIPDKLALMANQIAANTRHLPPDEAAQKVAAHLRQFWTPVMRSELEELADATAGDRAEPGDDPLSAVVRQALAVLRVTS